jgi:DedD protein
MSFFNLRRGGSSSQTQSGAPAENLDTVRKRAKHRLIGAAVLVLVGVVGFPLLFDSQPRPIPVDIAIEIPARQSVKPLATATPASVTPAPSAAPATPAPDPAPAAVASVTPAATPVPAVPAVPAAAPRVAEDSARAKALLEDKPVAGANAPTELRLVVQVGAFADAAKAREVRLKLEKAGLKTYTQVADSKEGKRTRVRVGPFASKAEADQAALKIKALDLPATILSL